MNSVLDADWRKRSLSKNFQASHNTPMLNTYLIVYIQYKCNRIILYANGH